MSQLKLKDYSKLFIVKWFWPNASRERLGLGDWVECLGWSNLEKDLQPADWEEVSKVVKTASRQLFYTTPYWRAVADRVAERDNHRCKKCKSQKMLECHHLTYDHFTSEHLHLDDLLTLCACCHALAHGHLLEAFISEVNAANDCLDILHGKYPRYSFVRSMYGPVLCSKCDGDGKVCDMCGKSGQKCLCDGVIDAVCPDCSGRGTVTRRLKKK